MQEQNSYPQMDQIKIDSVDTSVLSAESQRTLMQEIVEEQQPEIKQVVSQPKQKTKRVVVKRIVKKKSHSLKVEDTDSKEVADAKNIASAMARRLKVTSKVLITIGVIGVLMSLYGMVMAGHNVEWMVARHISHLNGSQGPEIIQGKMTRTEFHLIDNFRIISFFCLLKSVAICAIGFKTLFAIKKSTSGFTNLVFKKNLFRIAFIIVISMFTAHFVKDTHNVMTQHVQKYTQQRPEFSQNWQPEMIEEPEINMEIMEAQEPMPEIEDEINEESISSEQSENSEASNDEEEMSPVGRHLNAKPGHKGRGRGKKPFPRKRLLRMLKRFEQKIVNLKKEVNETQNEASYDFKQLNNYEQHLRWVYSQLKNSTSNSTIVELEAELRNVTDRIIFVKQDLVKANATHDKARLDLDMKALNYLEDRYQEIQQEIAQSSNVTRDQLLAMLKKDNSAILKYKELLGKANMTLSNDFKWTRIYEAKIQWVKEQLNRPNPPKPTPGKYTRDQLEAMLKNYTALANRSEQAMVADKSAGNKVQYYKDLAQFKIWSAKVEWVQKQLDRIPPRPPTPEIPTPANYTLEQLEEMLKSYLKAVGELKHVLAKDKASGDKKQYYTDLKLYKYALGNVKWAKNAIENLSTGIPTPGNYTRAQLEDMLKNYLLTVERYRDAMEKDKVGGNKTQYYIDKSLFEYSSRNVEWANRQLAKIPGNFTREELEGMLKKYTYTAVQAKRAMSKDRAMGNKTQYYIDLERYKEFVDKIEWARKELDKLPKESIMGMHHGWQMRVKGWFRNHEGQRGWFRNHEGQGWFSNHKGENRDSFGERHHGRNGKGPRHQGRHGKGPRHHGRNGKGPRHQGRHGKGPRHHERDEEEFLQGHPQIQLMDHYRPHVSESRMEQMPHGAKMHRSSRCASKLAKILMAILIGAHFYNLYKFKKALATINEASKKPSQIVDEEAVSVAPVSVPIVFGDKQEFPVVQQPTNYIVVQPPTQMQ